MIPAPVITEGARRYLEGRSLVVRQSPRHGCCGGQASLTVAEPGPPANDAGFRTMNADGVTVHLDRRLDDAADTWESDWTVAVDGMIRLRRLVVLDGVHAD